MLTPSSKPEWRFWAKGRRSSLPDVSDAVCDGLEAWLDTLIPHPPAGDGEGAARGGLTVLGYHAFGSELRLEPLVQAMPSLTWLTTRVNAGKHLSLHVFSSATVQNRYGILEPPPETPLLEPDEVDVALVPGLAFDVCGVRLGYGAGFYDRLLPRLRPGIRVVGVTLNALIVPELPSETHDVRMTHLATESGVRAIDHPGVTD